MDCGRTALDKPQARAVVRERVISSGVEACRQREVLHLRPAADGVLPDRVHSRIIDRKHPVGSEGRVQRLIGPEAGENIADEVAAGAGTHRDVGCIVLPHLNRADQSSKNVQVLVRRIERAARGDDVAIVLRRLVRQNDVRNVARGDNACGLGIETGLVRLEVVGLRVERLAQTPAACRTNEVVPGRVYGVLEGIVVVVVYRRGIVYRQPV